MRKTTLATLIKAAFLLIFLPACAVSKPDNPSATSRATSTTPGTSTLTSTNTYTDTSETDLASLIVAGASRLHAAVDSTIVAFRDAATDEGPDEAENELSALLQTIQTQQSEFEQAVQVYRDRFSALSPEAGSRIAEIETDLEARITTIEDLIADLDSGSIIDIAALDRLEEAWTTTGLEASVATWQETVLSQIDRREDEYMNIQAQSGQVADNRVEAFIQAHDFVEAFRTALEDEIFTPEELAQISQIGANAEASLFNTGDRQLFGYAQSIDDLTRNAVRGEWPLVSNGIEDLRLSLPARPDVEASPTSSSTTA